MPRRQLPVGPWISVSATTIGLNQVTAKMDPEVLFRSVRQSLIDTLEELRHDVRAYTPYASWETRDGISIEVNGSTIHNLNGRVFSPHRHFRVLEHGRRPGARMPPPGPLIQWIHESGADIDVKDVFVLQRKIQQRGLPALHIMRNALARQRPHFAVVFMRRIMEDWNSPTRA